jgi:long-chain acyl-CoA synthetase
MMGEERIWFKSYHPKVPHEVAIEKIPMTEVLTGTAGEHGSINGLIFMGKRLTYREMEGYVNRLAHVLIDLGVKKGDKVALLLPNLPQTFIADYAIHRIGAVTVPLNPLYTERELEYQLNDSDSTIAIALDLLFPRMESLKGKTGLKAMIFTHISDFLPFPKKQLFPFVKKEMFRKIEPQDGIYDFMHLLAKSSDSPVVSKAAWDDLGTLIYTGGTTGVSKGVMLTHANLSSNVQQFVAGLHDVTAGEKILFIFPFFHSAGYTVKNLCVWMGLTDILIPRPDPAAVADMIHDFSPDYVGAVPTIYIGMLALEKFQKMDVSFIKGFVSGAAPMPVEIIQKLKDLTGSTLLEVYGLTETTPVTTATPWRGKIKPGTVGVPVCSTDMKLFDVETGTKEVAIGEAGEIAFKGPQVMKGYYKKPGETAMVLKDGWLFTGDIGVMDDEGYLSIVDRKKDMIIAGGFNIYPKEIDEILFEHPKILEACTIGVPDSYRGETVKAYVVVKPGEVLTAEEVIHFCRERLAPYKVPKLVEFIDTLPKSAVGKILRRELRDLDQQKREGK